MWLEILKLSKDDLIFLNRIIHSPNFVEIQKLSCKH